MPQGTTTTGMYAGLVGFEDARAASPRERQELATRVGVDVDDGARRRIGRMLRIGPAARKQTGKRRLESGHSRLQAAIFGRGGGPPNLGEYFVGQLPDTFVVHRGHSVRVKPSTTPMMAASTAATPRPSTI